MKQVEVKYYQHPDARIKQCYQNAELLEQEWGFEIVKGYTVDKKGFAIEHYFNRECDGVYWDSTPIKEYCGDDIIYCID